MSQGFTVMIIGMATVFAFLVLRVITRYCLDFIIDYKFLSNLEIL